MLFTDFSLSPSLQKSIDDIGFTKCTDVQAETLKHALSGRDIFAQSQTGTGKTAAFLISLFEMIERSEYRERALIIVPTRELVTQIEAEARQLSVHLDLNFVSVYGGVGYDKQEQAIRNDVDIIIGTPGRLVDLCRKKTLNLKKFTFAVIDEADRMFDMGFVKDIRYLVRSMAPRDVRQTMLFSATLDYSIKRLSEDLMTDPVEITINPETMTVDKITQLLYHVSRKDKMRLLLGLIMKYDAQQLIIFSNTKNTCEEVAIRLNQNGYQAAFLTGDLPQRKRERHVNDFKRGDLKILVATDVAARGIHIDRLDLVVNYDIPQHAENYVHRIGRTARAGESGTAVTLACEYFVEFLSEIEKLIDMKVPSTVAIDEDFGEDKSTKDSWKRKKSGSSDNNKRRSNQGRGGSKNQKSGGRSHQGAGKKGSGKSTTSKASGSKNKNQPVKAATTERVRKKWVPRTDEELKAEYGKHKPKKPKSSSEHHDEHAKTSNKKRKRNPQSQNQSKGAVQGKKKNSQSSSQRKSVKSAAKKEGFFSKLGSIFKKKN